MTGRRLLILSLLFSLIATTAFYFYTQKTASMSVSGDVVEILVAKADISKNSTLTADMVVKKPFPKSLLPAGTVTKADELVGRVVNAPIVANEPILINRLVDLNNNETALTYSIPKGQRAVTIKYNEVMGVGGFIHPGDYLDVIGTVPAELTPGSVNKDISKILMQNLLVLAIGTEKAREPGQPAAENADKAAVTTITLAVSPEQGEKITFADERGSIRLMLRGNEDKAKVMTPGTTKDNLLNN